MRQRGRFRIINAWAAALLVGLLTGPTSPALAQDPDFLTIGGGETHGSGAFRVPPAMIGTESEGPLTFVTDTGETITLHVREFDLTQGVAYFLTDGAVPAMARAREAG